MNSVALRFPTASQGVGRLKNAKWTFYVQICTIICDNFETVRVRMSVIITNRKSHTAFD